MPSDENPFTRQCKKDNRKASAFQILHFCCSFSSDIMAVKGLSYCWVRCNNGFSMLFFFLFSPSKPELHTARRKLVDIPISGYLLVFCANKSCIRVCHLLIFFSD